MFVFKLDPLQLCWNMHPEGFDTLNFEAVVSWKNKHIHITMTIYDKYIIKCIVLSYCLSVSLFIFFPRVCNSVFIYDFLSHLVILCFSLLIYCYQTIYLVFLYFRSRFHWPLPVDINFLSIILNPFILTIHSCQVWLYLMENNMGEKKLTMTDAK